MSALVTVILTTMESLFLVDTLWHSVMIDILVNMLDHHFVSWGVMVIAAIIACFLIVTRSWVIVVMTRGIITMAFVLAVVISRI